MIRLSHSCDLIFQSVSRLCQPVGEEEEGVITVSLSNNLTELSIMETILKRSTDQTQNTYD